MNYKYNYRIKPLSFEERVNEAISKKANEIYYRNHSYNLIQNEDGNYDIISDERKIAEAMVDGSECIIDINEENKRYVRNTISRYYDEKYRKLFLKVREKKYGNLQKNENLEEVER